MGWITAQERPNIEVQAPTIEIWGYGLDKITTWADLRKLINDAHAALEHFYEVHCRVIAPERLVSPVICHEPDRFPVEQDSSYPSPDEGRDD